MIKYRMWDGSTEPSLPHDMGRIYPVGDALTKIVDLLGATHLEWGSWIEEMQPHQETGSYVIKIGTNGMAGERWIHVFEGPGSEIYPLAQVCWWFYQVTGQGSAAIKAATPRVVQEIPGHPTGSQSATWKPSHRGYPGVAIAA